MANNITYTSDAALPKRFWSHACLGLSKDIQDHEPNFLEKVGNIGTWPVENLPRIVKNSLTDPKVVTVALTIGSMYLDSMLFYPEETTDTVSTAWSLVPKIPYWAGKFALYLLSIETIAAYAARAEGRFMNSTLMTAFYKKNEE